VSVASTRVIERPTVGDLDNGVVLELLGDRAFYAERGKGARFYQNERNKKIKLSQVSDLEHMSWALSVPGRPAELVFNTAAKLIDHSSLRGGFFSCNSSAYGLTRLLTNQLDAYADIANRYYRDMPEIMRDKFINAGRGAVIGAAPYDLAAALLITKEAGCVVTDAFGKDFEDLLLLDSSESNFQSVVAAANPELHAKLMSYLDTRVGQLESVFRRRAEIMA
jgi:myo-inositol-1(or 4)-monophosphatase